MPIHRVEDPGDPAVEPYRRLRERDLAGRDGLLVAEGEVVVRVLLSTRSRVRPVSLLVSEARAAALGPWLDQVSARPLPVLVAAAAVMDAVVGFPIHRGLLALGRRDPAGAWPDLPAGPALALGLVGLANHDNVGAAFRNAAAFGATLVLHDAATCDPLYRKAIRVSAGAALTVPALRVPTAGAMLAELRAHGFTPFGLSPAGGERLETVSWPERTAILVGAEGPGLPPGLLAELRAVRIGMAPGIDSLNVAAAAAIALHAAARARRVD